MKNGIIELLRFLASLMIVAGHAVFFFPAAQEIRIPFVNAWFYVEFFLLLTGYLTARHFSGEKYCRLSIEDKVTGSMKYTIQKFSVFLPFSTIPVIWMYWLVNQEVLYYQGKAAFLRAIENLPFELLYLSAGTNTETLLFPLWTVSAMVMVFPVFCIICQNQNRMLTTLLAGYLSFVYYFSKYDYGSHVYPNQMIRAFCGMLAGYCIFQCAERLKNCAVDQTVETGLTILALITMMLPIAIAALNLNLLRIDLICFVLFFVIVFSGKSRLPICNNGILIYMGKLSMPIYIWHYAIGKSISRYDLPLRKQLVLMYMITVIVAIANLAIWNLVTKRWKERRKHEAEIT